MWSNNSLGWAKGPCARGLTDSGGEACLVQVSLWNLYVWPTLGDAPTTS